MKKSALAALAMLVLVTTDVYGVAITTNRLYLDNRAPTTSMYLYNSARLPTQCQVEIVDTEMTPDGNLRHAGAKSAKNSAANLVKFSPRRFEISGQSSQKINFVYRRRPNTDDGEYRGLFSIACREKTSQDANAEQILQVKPRLVQRIPLILRTRDIKLDGQLRALDSGDNVRVDLLTEGARSVTGDLKLINTKTSEVVASIKKLTIYNELPNKSYTLYKHGVNGNQLSVEFKELSDYGGDLYLTTNVQ